MQVREQWSLLILPSRSLFYARIFHVCRFKVIPPHGIIVTSRKRKQQKNADNMRKIVITLLLSALLMPATLLADSYTSLWKQYAAAQKKDLPQTQLKVLQDIISKSTAERAYGHLLKAQT